MSHPNCRGLVFAGLCLGLCAIVTPPRVRGGDAPPAGRQYALLVGVRNYKKDELRRLDYTENDVTELAQVLRDAGYKRVVLMTQSEALAQGDNDLEPTAKNIRRELKALLEDRKPEDAVLIAFSGHGVQPTKKGSYFCPTDAELTDTTTLISLTGVYYVLAKCPAAMKVLLVDACRNDPLAGGAKDATKLDLESVTRPQAEAPPGGVAALFSCSEGERSYESAKFKHGIFFHYVLEGLKGEAANKNGEVTLERLAAHVKDGAPDEAKDEWGPEAKQHPVLVGKLTGTAPLTASVKRQRNSLGMELVRIEAGTFLMGSPADDASRYDEELPQHEVTLSRPYFMGACPVTKGQFAAFVKDSGYQTEPEAGEGGWGYNAATKKFEGWLPTYSWRNTGFPQGADHPVVNVTWKDAVEFCKWLSKKEGKVYELPTEAEWEYACRAGTTTRFWCGDNDEDLKGNANLCDASVKAKVASPPFDLSVVQPWDDGYPFTSPVGKFKPNPWGLYDMHGNVWQWCADRAGPYGKSSVTDPKGATKGDLRILRGGAWVEDPRHCRSADRFFNDPVHRQVYMGFRVVLRPAATAP